MSAEGYPSFTPIAHLRKFHSSTSHRWRQAAETMFPALTFLLATLLRTCILQAAEEAKQIGPCQSMADMRSRDFAVQLTYAGRYHPKSGVVLLRRRVSNQTE